MITYQSDKAIHPDCQTIEFDSVADMVDSIETTGALDRYRAVHGGDWRQSWHGVTTWADCKRLALHGDHTDLDRVLSLADEAARTILDTAPLPRLEFFMDTTGGAVDIGAFLNGEPECMVNLTFDDDTSVSKVVYLSASVVVSAGVDTDVMRARGVAVAALVQALAVAGYTTVLYVEYTAGTDSRAARLRVQVKGANDGLDMAKVMFAFAHPGMARVIMLAALYLFEGARKPGARSGVINHGLGPIRGAIRDLPDGAYYTPPLRTYGRGEGAEEFVMTALRATGIIPADVTS